MATTYYAPDPIQSTQFIPGSATPANGGQLFFYLAGTSTKQTVYKDNAAATAWSNPIVLDSGGNLPLGGEVWFTQGISYKVIFAPANDADPPASPYWTKDNLTGINDVSSTTSEWIAGPAPTFVSATSFTLTGDQTATFTVGRRVRTTNTGGTVYSTITNSVFGALTTVTVVNDSSTLDSGLSAVAYSILASNNVSVPQSSYNVQPQQGGRLTLSSGQPVTSTDVVSTVLYWTPYKGNTVDIYDGSANWRRFTYTEVSTVAPAVTGVRDAFLYATSGTLTITTLPWTNDTTRATTVAFQNGIPVLSGDTGKLYLGTYWNTSGTIPDTASTRCLWNYWNRVERSMFKTATTASVVYPVGSSGIISVFGGHSTNALTIVHGEVTALVQAQTLSAGAQTVVTTSAGSIKTAVCVDAFNNMSSGIVSNADTFQNHAGNAQGVYVGAPGIGLHTLAWVQLFSSLTSFSFVGSSSVGSCGITGTFRG